MKKLLLFCFVFLLSLANIQVALAQNKAKIDSLTQKIAEQKPDTTKVILFYQLANELRNVQPDKAMIWAESGLLLADSLQHLRGKGLLYNCVGQIYSNRGNYTKAIDFLSKSLTISKLLKDKNMQMIATNNLGSVNLQQANYETALAYYLETAKINEEMDNERGLSAPYNNIGIIYKQQNFYDKALDYYFKAKAINEKHKNYTSLANTLNNIATIYTDLKKYNEAAATVQQAIALNQKQNNNHALATNYTNLASIYTKQKNHEQAIVNLQQAIAISKLTNNKLIQVGAYLNLCRNYTSLQNFAKAQTYLDTTSLLLKTFKNRKLDMELDFMYHEFYEQQGKYKEALLSIKQYQEVKDSIFNKDKTEQLARMQASYDNEKKEKENELLRKENDLTKYKLETQTLFAQQQQQKNDLLLAENKLKASDLEKQKLFNQQQIQQNTLLATENQLKVTALEKQTLQAQQLKIQAENQQNENKLLKKEQEIQKVQAEIDKSTIQRQYFIGMAGVFFLAIMGLLLFIVHKNAKKEHALNIALENQKTELALQKNQIEQKAFELTEANQQITVQNEELYQQQEEILAQRDHIEQKNTALEIQHSHITASIRAAKMIQEAILPFENRLKEILPDYFVLYKPKDVVSGDFYWIEKIDNQLFIAVVDCTGHGVPGAFMSMIGNTLLDNIIKFQGIKYPSDVLENLHKLVQVALKQQDTQQNDHGMDLGLVVMPCIDKQPQAHYKLLFAGAKRPLFYTINNKIEKLNGTRKSIGSKNSTLATFITNEVTLQQKAMLYLCSDGFADQCNENRIGMGEATMMQLFQTNCGLSCQEQGQAIDNFLIAFQQEAAQRDDILIFGLRLEI
jgi:serine phosphatase RsbU (regulator of sigma subunit)